jgi:hypothetical protein
MAICAIALNLPHWLRDYGFPLQRRKCPIGHKISEDLMSYGPPWAHYLGGYQDRLLGGPLGLPGLRYTAPEGMEHKDYAGVVLS